MTLQEALYALLEADTGVSALALGIYAGAAPDDSLEKYPCASYKLVGGSSDPTLSTSGTIKQRVELNGHGLTYAAAANLRAAIIAAVNGWQVAVSGGPNILNAMLLNPGTDFEPGEDRIFRCMVEFYILYTLS